ncbi:MAG: hypothetical protein NTZ80_02905 [Patescibacteria group bacterium]|nr:hypothetical protein [Patescibacteria group bacterium]
MKDSVKTAGDNLLKNLDFWAYLFHIDLLSGGNQSFFHEKTAYALPVQDNQCLKIPSREEIGNPPNGYSILWYCSQGEMTRIKRLIAKGEGVIDAIKHGMADPDADEKI